MRVELTDGGWANIRDPRKVPERLAEKMEDAQFELMELPAAAQFSSEDEFQKIQDLPTPEQVRLIGRDGFKAIRRLRRATVLVYVTEWSYSETVSEDEILEVPSSVLVEISDEVGKIIKSVGGPGLNTDPSPDTNSPTVRSED